MCGTIPDGLRVSLQDLIIFAYFGLRLAASLYLSAGVGAPGGGFGVWLRHLGNCGSSEGSNMILTQGVGEQSAF